VGFYGLMGAGMTETAESICGHRPVVGGKIIFENEEIKRLEVSTMIRKGVYFIPSDRHRYSIFRDFSIRENLTIAHLADLFPEIVLNNQKEKRLVDEKITQFGIKCSDCNQRMDELSGGNQQKVVVTRWLLKNCKVLIVDDPTVGIDIGAKHDIYLMMRKLNQMGVGIILISSEIAEVLSMSDRIYTMRDGAITAELKADQITQENILQNIL
jgi:ribose transport system ATP-binding protein